VNNLDYLKTETAEILSLKREIARGIIGIGKLQLGPNASLKQICNHVAPQFNLKSIDCMSLILRLGVFK
jgi:hypothetical protein